MTKDSLYEYCTRFYFQRSAGYRCGSIIGLRHAIFLSHVPLVVNTTTCEMQTRTGSEFQLPLLLRQYVMTSGL